MPLFFGYFSFMFIFNIVAAVIAVSVAKSTKSKIPVPVAAVLGLIFGIPGVIIVGVVSSYNGVSQSAKEYNERMKNQMNNQFGSGSTTVIDDPAMNSRDMQLRLKPAAYEKVSNLIMEDRKIEAIKLVRECTGLGLKEAKEGVDLIEISLKSNSNNYSSPVSSVNAYSSQTTSMNDYSSQTTNAGLDESFVETSSNLDASFTAGVANQELSKEAKKEYMRGLKEKLDMGMITKEEYNRYKKRYQ